MLTWAEVNAMLIADLAAELVTSAKALAEAKGEDAAMIFRSKLARMTAQKIANLGDEIAMRARLLMDREAGATWQDSASASGERH